MSMTDIISNHPLTPAVFHILLALSSGERHGYGIMKQVEADTQGKVNMGNGTLYGSLKRMLDAGLVEESDKRVDPEMDDERRIYYQITGVGAQTLAAELERYKRIVTLAQQRSCSQKQFPYDSSKYSPRILQKVFNVLPQNVQRTICRVHGADIPGSLQ
jgi:DNA-binding PadR family transcriptional regulator